MQNGLFEAEEGEIVELDTPSQNPLNGAAAAATATPARTLDRADASANGTKKRGGDAEDGRNEQEHQVKNSIRELASSSSSPQTSNSPAKIRKLDHADIPSSSRSSSSEGLSAIHIGDVTSSPRPDKDVEMAPASPARSTASSDHRGTTSASRRDERRSQSRDIDDSTRSHRRDSPGRYESRSSYHGSSRSRRSPSPRSSHSSSRR